MNVHTHPRSALFRRLLLLAAFSLLLLVGCGDSGRGSQAGESLLDLAERGDTQAVARLLGRDPRPDVRDACDWTPLMKAAMNGHLETIELLLAAGASIDAGDQGGYTALMFAVSHRHPVVVARLLDAGAMIDHQERTKGWTPLIWAANLGYADIVEILLAQGADLTLRDFDGLNAADHAAAQGHPPLAEHLRLILAAR